MAVKEFEPRTVLDDIWDYGKDIAAMPFEWIIGKIKEGAINYATDFIEATPIIVGVSIASYALFSMISEKLAKMSVVGVFIYGGMLVLIV